MLRVTRGAAPATSQAIDERLASIEAKIDALAELMAQAMIAEPEDDEDEHAAFGGERDQSRPL